MKKRKSLSLAQLIQKCYEAYNVNILLELLPQYRSPDSVLFRVHIVPGTTISSLMSRTEEVKTVLQLPYFIIAHQEQTVFLLVSRTNTRAVDLTDMLQAEGIDEVTRQLKLPIAVGVDIFMQPVYEDLAELKHIAYTGSTGSGKSVGLQCLITSLASFRSPEEVNFLIIDAGGGSLWCFEGLPHLSCPVIKDIDGGIYALDRLVAEMERRLKLSKEELDKLPAVVCVFDEFVSFLDAPDKKHTKACAKLINSILRRARKVGIFLVLATQSPKQEYLKDIDVNNLTTRVAFRNMSKANQSSALGVVGAENLMGKGDLLMDTQEYAEPLRLQGAYISESEIKERVAEFADKQSDVPNKFVVSLGTNCEVDLIKVCSNILGDNEEDEEDDTDDDDQQTSRLILWALSRTEVSVSKIQQELGFSRKVAEQYLEMLDKHGFLEAKNSNQPRKVIPQEQSDLNEEQLEFLSEYGLTEEILTELYQKRAS